MRFYGIGSTESMLDVDANAKRPATDGEDQSPPPVVEFLRQVGFIALAILLYFGVRGSTQGEVEIAIKNGLDVLAFEQRLGVDFEAWAQGLIIDRGRLVDVANWIYIWGHWPVIAATLIWLHRTRRYEFLILRNAMFISGAVGLVIFATYAVAPPRLLDVGLDDTVTQLSNSYRILQPPALVNKYAAIPSLHVGWNLLVGIALYRASSRSIVRAFAIASPILMSVAVVVTANHYFIDGILGSALALLGLAASVVVTPRMVDLDRRLRQRRKNNGLVDDQAVDPPVHQTPGVSHVGDRPAEDPSIPIAELGHQAGSEQSGVDDDTVHCQAGG